jgi:hypothetical protein
MKFHDYCTEQRIITLCMPPHSSHLLQPLDVGCFGPLKRAYSAELDDWSRYRITQVKKEAFLPAFAGAGLVPHDPERVLSKLDVVLRTPTPPLPEATLWESKTPANIKEVEVQSTLIRDSIRRHRELHVSPLIRAIDTLAKGVAKISYSSELQAKEMASMRQAITELTEQKENKREGLYTLTRVLM